MPTASTSTLPVRKSLKRARPKGLWKARASVASNGSRCCAPDVPKVDLDSDSDAADDWDTTSSESAFKRRRYSPSIPSSESTSDSEDTYRWDFSQRQTCRLDNQPLSFFERQTGWTRRQRVMDTSSTAFGGSQTEARTECSYEDWLDLKDLFRKAAEQYEEGSADEALPLLRGVIHECHSFLNMYDDPSTLFAAPKSPTDTPTSEWVPRRLPRKCKCVELPTAFHAILGTALFLFGNLIDHDGSLSLPGEPNTPMPYWLAALDVFETGENLPSRVYGTGCDAPEDWRMAIVWGRTLVALADATVLRAHEQPDAPAIFDVEDSHWSSDSPFAAIAMRRPPLTRRMSLSGTSPNDLLMLAMDQFSRGIFHMPHPQHQLDPRMFPLAAAACDDIKMDAPTGGGCHSKRVTSVPPNFSTLPAFAEHSSKSETFSRPKELYTIASEVLLLAEKLPNPSERKYWACWADSVLNQMKMEADMDAWRGTISRARGKCWLIAGTAHADDLEDSLENEDHDVRMSPQAEEARVGLEKAIGFLDKGRSDVEDDEKERKGMLAEALLTLSNLTLDPELAKLLFRRGEKESGENFMDVDA